MAAGEISAYRMGLQGVNTDKSPVLAEDSDLSAAQNAVPDASTPQFMGGIRKRPGLVKHNSSSVAAGSILGGIGSPVDPGDSDTDPGDTPPPGQMQVSFWFRMKVASGLGAADGFWYSLDGFSTNTDESGESAGT